MRVAHLPLIAVGVLACCAARGEWQRGTPSRSTRTFEPVPQADSLAALRAVYARAGFGMRETTLKCAGNSYAWFTVDQGSGGYVIHAMLYEVVGPKPRLVLYLPPETHRIAVTAVAEKDRIAIEGNMLKKPGDEL